MTLPAAVMPRRPRPKMATGRWWLLAAPALAVVTLVYLAPLASMLAQSVLDPEPGLQNFIRLVGGAGYQRVLVQTLWIGLVSPVLSLVIGSPVAYAIVRAGPVARRILM